MLIIYISGFKSNLPFTLFNTSIHKFTPKTSSTISPLITLIRISYTTN